MTLDGAQPDEELLGNLAVNPITALTMRRREVFRDPAARALALSLLEEAVVVGRAAGAKLAEDQAQRTLKELSGYSASGGSSMLYDRIAGKPLEHEYLTGAVVRAAERHAISVPVNRTILALLEALKETPTLAGVTGKPWEIPPADSWRPYAAARRCQSNSSPGSSLRSGATSA